MNKCKKCYGKGYRTEIRGIRELPKKFNDGVGCYTYSEHSGKPVDSFIKVELCDCERGKDLKKYFKLKQ